MCAADESIINYDEAIGDKYRPAREPEVIANEYFI